MASESKAEGTCGTMNKTKCLLGVDPELSPKCKPTECPNCGWNEREALFRRAYLQEYGLTLCGDGLRRLVIPKAEREGGSK